ncbi:MAG: hypothetical protein K0A90_08890 [Methanosarcinaceae archaeon]|nr:hypothetical protein [Methanosarcinaceae archaeon]
MTRQAIGQKTVGRVRFRTVIPGDPHPGRSDPGIGAMAMEVTAALRMRRAANKGCFPPPLSGNVFLAGE